jgi:hypothetical protein
MGYVISEMRRGDVLAAVLAAPEACYLQQHDDSFITTSLKYLAGFPLQLHQGPTFSYTALTAALSCTIAPK